MIESFPEGKDTDPMVCQKADMQNYSEHIYYMDANPETDQPFIYYIKGSSYSLQIDAGNSKDNYCRFLLELRSLQLPAPSLMVLTHWHWDHTFGVYAAECPVIASEETYEILKKVSAWEWTEDAMKARLKSGEDIPFTYDCMHRQYSDLCDIHVQMPDITFTGRMTIDLGDVVCHLEHRDSPHTRDAVFIHIPKDRVLIGGDAHYEDYYDNNSQYDKERLTAFLEYLNRVDFDWYLKGHDEPGIRKEELISYLNEKKMELQ